MHVVLSLKAAARLTGCDVFKLLDFKERHPKVWHLLLGAIITLILFVLFVYFWQILKLLALWLWEQLATKYDVIWTVPPPKH